MTTSEAPWFVTAFGRDYLAVYAHRDDASARGEADFAVRALGAASGARVLDLGCGAGRHSRALSAHGFEVVGVDLSADLLAAAAGRGGRGARRGAELPRRRSAPKWGRLPSATMGRKSPGEAPSRPRSRIPPVGGEG